jgi:hypothetical protein
LQPRKAIIDIHTSDNHKAGPTAVLVKASVTKAFGTVEKARARIQMITTDHGEKASADALMKTPHSIGKEWVILM